jgi:hypothetical protein
MHLRDGKAPGGVLFYNQRKEIEGGFYYVRSSFDIDVETVALDKVPDK